MQKKEKKDRQLYAVIGLGRFGFAVAEELARKGKDVLAIDRERDIINRAAEFTDNAFVLDALSVENLDQAGLADADVAVIGIGSKIDVSILTTLNVMKLGVKRVIAKATSREQGEVLERLGAEVIYPEHDMAIRLAGRLASPFILDYISLSDTVDIMELSLTPKVDGKTVLELNVRKTYGLNIIAIRHDGEMNTSILPTTTVREKDTIAVIGKTEDIRRFETYLHS
ncbi:MAG: TrkA family potassium uptake protein [Clostridia bacterium]|nr:TrkA family potassium uptake protein [Clostridia bacterium]